jgi:hypothetical protein
MKEDDDVYLIFVFYYPTIFFCDESAKSGKNKTKRKILWWVTRRAKHLTLTNTEGKTHVLSYAGQGFDLLLFTESHTHRNTHTHTHGHYQWNESEKLCPEGYKKGKRAERLGFWQRPLATKAQLSLKSVQGETESFTLWRMGEGTLHTHTRTAVCVSVGYQERIGPMVQTPSGTTTPERR